MYRWAEKKISHPAANAKALARTFETNWDMKSSVDSISSTNNIVNNSRKYSINPIPSTISEDVENNIKKLKEIKPVTTIKDNVFGKGKMKLSEQVEQYFNSIGNNVYNEIIGDVELNHTDVKSDMAHGIGRIKAVTFKAIPSVIKKGKIVDY